MDDITDSMDPISSYSSRVNYYLLPTENSPISHHSRIIFPCLTDRDGEIEQPELAVVAQSKASLSHLF